MQQFPRTKSSAILSLTAALALPLMSIGVASAVCVDPSGADGCETTIQAGVDATAPGGTVDVRAGVYFEAVVVDVSKTGLQIVGEGPKKTRIRDHHELSLNSVGIDIDADNVTIQGLALEGVGDDGILVDANGVTIRDVLIAVSERDGVDVNGADATIEGVRVVGAGSDGLNLNGAGIVVRDSHIERVGGSCIDSSNQDGGVIEGTTALMCGDYGFDVDGDDLRIEGNTVEGSPGEECLSISSDRVQVLGNTFRMCEGALSLSGDRPIAEKNTVEGSFNGSMRVQCNDDCGNARVVKNKISAIDSGGLRVSALAAGGMLVEGNRVTAAIGNGVSISGEEVRLINNKVSDCGARNNAGFDVSGSNHTVEGNQVSGQGGPGFRIQGSGHILTKNKVTTGMGDGFRVEAAGVGILLTSNLAIGNDGTGFEILAGANSTSLSANKGSKNRVDFCDEGTATDDDGSNKFATTGACGVD